jgi:hypothetical protein
MVGSPVLITKDPLTLSGRPLYLKTDRKSVEQLKQQIRRAERVGIADRKEMAP